MVEIISDKIMEGRFYSKFIALFLLVLTICVTTRVYRNQVEVLQASYGSIPEEPYYSHVANAMILSRVGHIDDNNRDSIFKIAERLVQAKPYWAPYHFQAAWAYLKDNKKKPAATSLKKAIRLWPTKGLLLAQSAPMLDLAGEEDLAYDSAKTAFLSRQTAARFPLNFLFNRERFKLDQIDDLLEKNRKTIYGKDIDYLPRLFWQASRDKNTDIMARAIEHATLPEHLNILNRYAVHTVSESLPEELNKLRSKFALLDNNNLLINGGLDTDLLNGYLGWYLGKYENVGIKQDTRNKNGGKASLRIRFNGKENVRSYHPFQYVVTQKGIEDYSFSGMWKADGLTTRTLPKLRVYLVKDKKAHFLTEISTRKGRWDWERFELNFKDNLRSDFILIRLERAKSKDLDNKISGDLWLDSLSLVPKSKLEGY